MRDYRKIKQILESYRDNISKSNQDIVNITRVEEFIISNLFDASLTIGYIRDQCRIYNESFSTKFALTTGNTPKSYILYHRINAGKSLLIKTEASITTIAISVGFSSLAAFDNAFKDREGLRPSHWRKTTKDKGEVKGDFKSKTKA